MLGFSSSVSSNLCGRVKAVPEDEWSLHANPDVNGDTFRSIVKLARKPDRFSFLILRGGKLNIRTDEVDTSNFRRTDSVSQRCPTELAQLMESGSLVALD